MTWMEQLLDEYKQGHKELNMRYEKMAPDDPDRKTIGGMVRDMSFTMEWLETRRMPEKAVLYHPLGEKEYWDDSIGAYVVLPNYKNPFLEVEERIDRELEAKRNESSRTNRGSK